MQLRRLAITSAVALASISGLSACGSEENPNAAEGEGTYVTAGSLQYQVQISRQLTQTANEDRDYLVGLQGGTDLPTGQNFFGVFLRAFNRSDEPQQAASDFFLTDTTGKRYDPVPVDAQVNRAAFRSWVLQPGDQLPVPGSFARENATQGGLILFKVPTSAYAARPLELHIEPESGHEGTVALDV